MAKTLTKDTSEGITETFEYDEVSGTVGVRRTQDVQSVLDIVADANLEGVRAIDGLGLKQAEVPINVAIDFCQKRGIPWEKFLYTNEFNDEWGKFLSSHPNLNYRPAVRYHPVKR